MLFNDEHRKFMTTALKEAEKAFEKDEVPIGSVIVLNNKIIAKGFNQTEMLHDATAHAEMIAITSASGHLNSKTLDNCDIYITVEPCVMCAGAILLARFRRIYFGAFEPKYGAAGSLFNILESGKYNHKPEVYSGLMEMESKYLIQEYFRKKRNNIF